LSNVGEDASPQGKVRVEDFPSYTFSIEAIPEAVRASWKYPSEE
jgi:hypothetical protein